MRARSGELSRFFECPDKKCGALQVSQRASRLIKQSGERVWHCQWK